MYVCVYIYLIEEVGEEEDEGDDENSEQEVALCSWRESEKSWYLDQC